MTADFSYFFWLGSFSLLILSWQDVTQNNIIDDRKNYIMLGVAISLARLTIYMNHSIWYKLFIIAASILLSMFASYFMKKNTADGDLGTIRWIVLGLCFISIYRAIAFIILLFCLTLLMELFIAFLIKKKLKIAFMPYLMALFVLMGVLMGGF